LRLKISLAQSDEQNEKFTRPNSDLTRKYERARGFFEAWVNYRTSKMCPLRFTASF